MVCAPEAQKDLASALGATTTAVSEPVVRWCREHIAALEVANAGGGIHFVQGYEPEAIASMVGEWRRRGVTV